MVEVSSFSPEELGDLQQVIPSSSGSPESRFVQECVQYFREWSDVNYDRIKAGAVSSGSSLLLVYSESPRTILGLPQFEGGTYPRARRKTCSLESGVAVCNENLGTILKVLPCFVDADAAMSFIEENLLCSHTFVLILFGQRRVFIHYSELSIGEWLESPYELKISDKNDEITPDLIAEEISTFHDECTRTHLGSVARFMWGSDETHFWLERAPESRIQSGLLIHLKGRFKAAGVLVHEEVVNPGGRTDIQIFRAATSSVTNSVTTMLELKFLSPFNNFESNCDWAIKGVVQAAGYRKIDTDACFALAFDARQNKGEVLNGFSEVAQSLNVRAERYEMELPALKPKRKSPKK